MEVFNGGGDDDFWDFADNFSVDEEPLPLLGREVTRDQADEIPFAPAPVPEHGFSTWTRVTSLARALDQAAEHEDWVAAGTLQARAGRPELRLL